MSEINRTLNDIAFWLLFTTAKGVAVLVIIGCGFLLAIKIELWIRSRKPNNVITRNSKRFASLARRMKQAEKENRSHSSQETISHDEIERQLDKALNQPPFPFEKDQ